MPSREGALSRQQGRELPSPFLGVLSNLRRVRTPLLAFRNQSCDILTDGQGRAGLGTGT